MNKKIFMVTMMMDIGGAETHILELSKQLSRMGYDVIVASNGGAFVEDLTKNNIKHYKVPLHDKKIGNVIRSYKMLKKIIVDENVDIVHAHARIPAFICGKLKKKLNFKFVTTTHGNYKTSLLLNLLTDWGEKTLAVSSDIRNYLIKNYNIDKNNIKLTVNGINSELFNENIVAKNIKNIDRFKDSINILHVSRLENTTNKPALSLINNADKLLKINKKIKIIIVGAGKEYESIKKLADDKNNELKREVIFVEGAQTNVNEYISICDFFVGISRAALEAMLMKKVVVLSGNYGYMGIFDKEKLQEGILNNFTCRDSAEFNENVFIGDVIKVLNMDEDKKEKIAEFSKQTVLNNYSINKMVNDAVEVYNDVLNEKKLDVLVFGYIGFNNSGDDAIFDIFSKLFLKKYPNAKITVLSNSSIKLSADNKIKHVYCFNIFKIIKEIRHNQMVIANGGSLLQDTTSSRSLYYYLGIIWLAKLFNKKVAMLANGLGPINKKYNKKLVKKIVDRADLITFRDNESYELAMQLGIKRPDIRITADMVFNYKDMKKIDVCNEILAKEKVPANKKLIGLVIRPWGNSERYVSNIARLCDKFIDGLNVNILFIPMQKTKRINDMLTNQEIIEKMSNKAYVLKETYNYEEINSIIRNMEIIISMRLHSVIYALLNNVPVYGLAYQSKVKSYLEEVNLPVDSDLDNLDVDKIYKESVGLIQNKDTIAKNIDIKIIELKEKAAMNMSILEEHIEKWF